MFTGRKGTKLSPAFRYFYRANRLQFTNLFVSLHPSIQLKYVFIMARPIKETPMSFDEFRKTYTVHKMGENETVATFDCGDEV